MQSMTGFASIDGGGDTASWRWEARSVNGRGLELRLRLPPGWDGQEAAWRKLAGDKFKRGTLNLTLSLTDRRSETVLVLNDKALDAAITAASQATARLATAGVDYQPLTVAGLLQLRGVLDGETSDRSGPSDETVAAVAADLKQTLAALHASRIEEGGRIKTVLDGLLTEIETLAGRAAVLAEERQAGLGDRIRDKIGQILDAGATIDEGRLAQELALITVKWDVREELDRLAAHIASARDLLAAREPIGRKLDFLTQEFNREANTLCSKSQDAALTEVGLALKVAIDQMREQAANVE